MKIKSVTDYAITFDNGKEITYYHYPDCCEDNYADFSVLNPNVINYDYDFEEPLVFKLKDEGFIFGNEGHMIFIPCYSEQNGCYTTDVDIRYDGECVLSVYAEFVYRD